MPSTLRAVDLDREHRPLGPLIRVGAHGRAHEVSSPRRISSSNRLATARMALRSVSSVALMAASRSSWKAGIEPRGERAVQRGRRLAVSQQHAVDRVGVQDRADLQQVVPERAEHLDIAPGQPFAHQQLVQRIVGRASLLQRAQRGSERDPRPRPGRVMIVRRRLDAQPLEKDLAGLPGSDDRDGHLFADRQARDTRACAASP